jgi:hypothetical protein
LTSKKKLPCTTTGCRGRLKKTEFSDLKKKKPMVIPAAQLFAALGGGVGLPEEKRRASPILLTSRFTGAKLANIDGIKVGDKTIVSSITFDNGFTMHFGVSTKGAAIYKVTEEEDVR